jgi:hypothetical protein
MDMASEIVTEADILDQLVTADEPGFSAEGAQAILSLRFSSAAVGRMNELAERNRQGSLSETDRAALDNYLRVGRFLNIVQAKARVWLSRPADTGN